MDTYIDKDDHVLDQVETVISGGGNMSLLLFDHKEALEERAQYIDDCEWPEKLQKALDKQREVNDLLEDLRSDLESHYHSSEK